MWLLNKYPKARLMLDFLIDQMDNYNAVMCSHVVLEEAFEISYATVSRNIKVLKEHGFIAVYKSGTSNVYTINPDIAWKSWGGNNKYCRFPANIIISLSEQDRNNNINFADLQTEKIKSVSIKSEN
jgi:DNA-binding transcriptional ArsR family regulator